MGRTARHDRSLFLVLGNQLFPTKHLRPCARSTVFMAEDHASCTYVRHHQQKLILILAAMRAHAGALRAEGFDVHYERLEVSPRMADFYRWQRQRLDILVDVGGHPVGNRWSFDAFLRAKTIDVKAVA